MTALADVLALDPGLRVLVVHGYTDLVTPYFGSDAAPPPASGRDRLRGSATAIYRGGHMFYTRPNSRRAFRSDAAALYGASAG